jgi:hypothetical protein
MDIQSNSKEIFKGIAETPGKCFKGKSVLKREYLKHLFIYNK